jgi:hypothetical protein
MCFDCLHAKLQDYADGPVGLSFRDQLDNVLLSRREQHLGLVLVVLVIVEQFLQQGAGKIGTMTEQFLDRRNKVLLGIRFEQKPTDAGQKGFSQDFLTLVHCENKHFRARTKRSDATTNLQAVHNGHRIVDDGDIGLGFQGERNRLLAVDGFSSNNPMV